MAAAEGSTGEEATATAGLTPGRFGLLLAIILSSMVLALASRLTVSSASSLHSLGAAEAPYFQPGHAPLLYGLAPLVALASFVFFLAPGLLWTLLLWRPRDLADWSVMALGASIVAVGPVSAMVKLTLGGRVTTGGLMGSWVALTLLGAIFLWFRLRSGEALRWPMTATDRRRLLQVVAFALMAVALLVPKIFWEDFNSDGIESFEFGRSLASHYLPHWEIRPGAFGFYQNYVLFSFPNHWFLTLFGSYEAAVRLPFFLYVALTLLLLFRLAEHKSPRKLRWVEEIALWCGLAVFVTVMAFSSASEPHYADLAEHGAVDCLWVLAFLATVNAVWSGRKAWVILFALMTHLASAGGLLCLLAFGAMELVFGARERRPSLLALGSGLTLIGGVSVAHHLYMAGLLQGGRDQFGVDRLVARLFPPDLTNFHRLNALLFPAGLLPALSLSAIRPREAGSWILGGVTLGFFGVIYLQSWAFLHQLAPAMLVPLAVYWRLYLHHPKAQGWLLPTTFFAAAVSFYLSLPQHWRIIQTSRAFGAATEYRIGDYDSSYREAAAGAHALPTLLPANYRLQYPNQPWGTDGHVWVYYATRPKIPGAPINYIVQPAVTAPPERTTKAGDRQGIAVYVRDVGEWERLRQTEYPRRVASPLYEPMLSATLAFFRDYAARHR